MSKVVVTDQAFGNTDNEEAMAINFGADFSTYQLSDEAETAKAVKDANVVLNNFAPMSYKVLKELAKDAVVIRYGVGVDNVDLKAADELGVRICNVPDYGVNEVADHAVAMAIFLSRKIHTFDAAIRRGSWKIAEIAPNIRSLSETTLGLIGFGRIAQEVAHRMKAFGCKIIAYDPFVDASIAENAGVTLTRLEDVLSHGHILSLHIPLNSKTRHIIDEQAIKKMPTHSIIINASRGGLIDENALANALQTGHIAAAGLDVFEIEPLPDGSPLRKAPNLYLSPHAAFYSNLSVTRLQQLASEEALRALKGEPLRCQIV